MSRSWLHRKARSMLGRTCIIGLITAAVAGIPFFIVNLRQINHGVHLIPPPLLNPMTAEAAAPYKQQHIDTGALKSVQSPGGEPFLAVSRNRKIETGFPLPHPNNASQGQQSFGRTTGAQPSSANVHIIFSTDCSPFQNWQSVVVYYSEGQAHLLQQHGHPCGGRVTRCAACSCTAAMILRTLGNRSCAGASHHTPAVRAGDLDETCACARHSVGWRGRPYSSYARTLRCDRETNF